MLSNVCVGDKIYSMYGDYPEGFYEVTSVDTDNISEFVPFEELTLNQTIEWINQTDSVNDYKQYLCDIINNQINPPPPTTESIRPVRRPIMANK